MRARRRRGRRSFMRYCRFASTITASSTACGQCRCNRYHNRGCLQSSFESWNEGRDICSCILIIHDALQRICASLTGVIDSVDGNVNEPPGFANRPATKDIFSNRYDVAIAVASELNSNIERKSAGQFAAKHSQNPKGNKRSHRNSPDRANVKMGASLSARSHAFAVRDRNQHIGRTTSSLTQRNELSGGRCVQKFCTEVCSW